MVRCGDGLHAGQLQPGRRREDSQPFVRAHSLVDVVHQLGHELRSHIEATLRSKRDVLKGVEFVSKDVELVECGVCVKWDRLVWNVGDVGDG